MTAFAREQASTGTYDLCWEIKSVNHRYLDCSFRVPEDYRYLETRLQSLVRERINRGKIDCTLKISRNSTGPVDLEIDDIFTRNLAGTIEKLSGIVPSLGQISPVELLKWPGVLKQESGTEEQIEPLVLSLFSSALASLAEMRKVEGDKLRQFILTQLGDLEHRVTDLRKMVPVINAHLEEKIRTRLVQLEVQVDPQRVEQEIVLLVQKADIQEELDRLSSHILEIKNSFQQSRPLGRRLDFLMQELNREANTIASKSALPDSTMESVEIKVLIEQMREQVQNLE